MPSRSLWRAATVTSTASITGFLSMGIDHRVEIEPCDAFTVPRAPALGVHGIADDQFATRSLDAPQYALRNLHVLGTQRTALSISRNGCFHLAGRIRQQQYAPFG